ncbi:hypothetical protein [Brachybacterium sp.]|uniref:hypothetical protein n=1 Tax=Brachybacterium sp. TaxID=1891286 RepID=UPI002ED0751C
MRPFSDKLTDATRWNANFKTGVLVGLLCPKCQTQEEFLEAETNAANLADADLVSFRSLDPTKRAELIIEMIDKSAHTVIEKHRKKAERTGKTRVRVDVQAWAAEAAAGVPAIQGQSESFMAHAREIAAEYISGALGLTTNAAKA